jgi:hypothetical protein
MLPACKCSICRKCYVHPEVLNSYMDGNLVLELKSKAESELRTAKGSLKPEEAAVLALLRSRLAKEAEQSEGSRAKGSSQATGGVRLKVMTAGRKRLICSSLRRKRRLQLLIVLRK